MDVAVCKQTAVTIIDFGSTDIPTVFQVSGIRRQKMEIIHDEFFGFTEFIDAGNRAVANGKITVFCELIVGFIYTDTAGKAFACIVNVAKDITVCTERIFPDGFERFREYYRFKI